jgi:SAM-dependent methyltransferase
VSANVDQIAAWDGDDGAHWSTWDGHYDAAAAGYNHHLFDAAAITSGDRVLDVGCGCGHTTVEAAQRSVDGSALGVDLSAQMLARAEQRAAERRVPNAKFVQADAQTYPFEKKSFDVVISRFGAMFFDDPVVAFGNLHDAMTSNGRLAVLSWQPLAVNEWVQAIRTALSAGRALPEPPVGAPGPFGLADREAIDRILTASGFHDIRIETRNEPMRLGESTGDALSFVSTMGITRGMLRGLDERTADRALEELRATLADHATARGVYFGSGALLTTARRT